MQVSVFGMGYVGCVTAAALCHRGHFVTGVDVNELKVRSLQQGKAPVLEPGLQEIVSTGVATGRLRASTNGAEAVGETDVSLVCVGTPSNKNGSFDYAHLLNAITEVGEGIRRKSGHHAVAVRSTVLPGTTEEILIPQLEKVSGKRAGKDFSVHTNPEFLRESTALRDFDNPPFVVIGSANGCGAGLVEKLYEGTGPVCHTSIKTAETLKYVCNTFHALKITFANEIGAICQAVGVDSHEVMELFCRDRQLNISPAYLKPGFAYGGSCLPKDLRALVYQARKFEVPTPMLEAIGESNRAQIQRAIDYILDSGCKNVGMLGLTFKAGTDDLRESPLVSLCEALIGKGIGLSIYDPNLLLSNLIGANKAYIETQLPHIGRLLCDSFDELIERVDLVILGNRYAEFEERILAMGDRVRLLDLVRYFSQRPDSAHYRGICW